MQTELAPAAPARREQAAGPGVAQSLREYGRGLAGGLIFSLPLLYTAEVWWAGFTLTPWRLLAGLTVTFALLLGYNRFAGLRSDASWVEVAIDSVEELGLGILVSALILALLGRLRPDMPPDEIAGKVVLEALVVAIGVSVGTAQLGEPPEDEVGMDDEPQGPPEVRFGEQLVLAVCGAVLFAINIAPTEEIQIIALEIGPWRLLGLVALSLALGAVILHYAEFSGARRFVRADGPLNALSGAVVTYAVALVVSAAILWFFGRFDGVSPGLCLAQAVVLGMAAALGASAGRLLLQ
ncbi:MAG TPA: TIGR02587 family membrane protein [Roseiflexaceae bacterium]|nr:TIGR02587 family membrane protein [Roseiflexaceae bacterium]